MKNSKTQQFKKKIQLKEAKDLNRHLTKRIQYIDDKEAHENMFNIISY